MQNRDLVADAIRNNGVWEQETSILINEFLTKQFINGGGSKVLFVDIGANLGFHALYAAKLGANVWAVEPQETNLNKVTLLRKLSDNYAVCVGIS